MAEASDSAGRGVRVTKTSSRKRKVNAACSRCRQTKRRCDAGRPKCIACVRSGSVCAYETLDANESRVTALKRQNVDLQEHVDSIARGLTRLGALSNDEAAAIFNRLRSSSDAFETLRSLDWNGLDSPQLWNPMPFSQGTWSPASPDMTMLEVEISMSHPAAYPLFGMLPDTATSYSSQIEFPEPVSPSSPNEYPTPASSATFFPESQPRTRSFQHVVYNYEQTTLCDDRLRDLNISYWTTVPIPNALATVVMSLYLQTEHPIYGFFDSDLFVHDLVKCRLDFCSPFLVSAVFYWACHTYGALYPEAKQFASSFFLASTKLYEMERDNVTVLNVPALIILSIGAHCDSKNDQAREFMVEGIRMANQIGLLGERRRPLEKFDLPSPDVARTYSFAAWSAFNFSTLHTWYFRGKDSGTWASRAPIIPVPESTDRGKPSSAYMGEVFPALCSFWPLVHGVLCVYHDSDVPLRERVPFSVAEKAYVRFLAWADKLPLSLRRNERMPHHTAILHIFLHSILMDLWRPFLSHRHPLSLFTSEQNSPKAIFTCSAQQLKDLSIFYFSTFAGKPAAFIICSMTAIVWGANASIQHGREPSRRDSVPFYLRAFEDLLKAHSVVETACQGIAALAVQAGVVSSAEARDITQQLQAARAYAFDETALATGFVVDLDTAMDNPRAAMSEQLALRFNELTVSFDDIR